MKQHTFAGWVSTDGRLSIHDRDGLKLAARDYAGKDIEVILRQRKSQRSLQQNAYIHSQIIPVLADHFGYTIPEMKLVLMGECWGWHTVHGHELPVKPHTSEMSVEDCVYFIDWAIPWAATEHGVTLMLPNEYVEAV